MKRGSKVSVASGLRRRPRYEEAQGGNVGPRTKAGVTIKREEKKEDPMKQLEGIRGGCIEREPLDPSRNTLQKI